MDILKRSVFAKFGPKSPERCEVVTCLKKEYGLKALVSVVRGDGGFFVTFTSEVDADDCVEGGITIDEEVFEVQSLAKKVITAQFFDLPEIVTDEAIRAKLEALNCTLRREIVRETDEDGIRTGVRSVRLQLPEGVSSLPYVLRFRDVIGMESLYKVKHEFQGKVCNRCLSADHLYKGCPQLVCRVCIEQGHIARRCPSRNIPEPLAENKSSKTPSHNLVLTPGDFPSPPMEVPVGAEGSTNKRGLPDSSANETDNRTQKQVKQVHVAGASSVHGAPETLMYLQNDPTPHSSVLPKTGHVSGRGYAKPLPK